MSENFWKYIVALIVVVFVIWLLYMYMSPSSKTGDSGSMQKAQVSNQVGQTGQVCPSDSDDPACQGKGRASTVQNFESFVLQIKDEAKKMGFREAVISRALNDVKFYDDIRLPKVLMRDYDNLRGISDILLFISDDDIHEIREEYTQFKSLILKVARKLNIDPKVLGVTYLLRLKRYEQNPEKRTIFDVLMSILYRYPGSQLMRRELFDAILLVSDGLNPKNMLAMNDGTMGVIRFLPSEYMQYAVSDKRGSMPDIWNDPYDSMLSLGRFLIKHGLNVGYDNKESSLMMRVDIPDNQQGLMHVKTSKPMHRCLPESVQMADKQTLPTWHRLGIKRTDGKAMNLDSQRKFYLLREVSDNNQDKGFLVDDNYFTILDYSCSHKFVLHVLNIADMLEA